jgi:hypothetical protein
MKARGILWILVVIAVTASSALGITHWVNCDMPGEKITNALQTAQPGDTIHVRGTCEETVTITTDRLTLRGIDNATIKGPGGGQARDVPTGLVNIVGVQGVEIRGFTIQDSLTDGINGRQGAAFTVQDVRVRRNADDGIEATENSTVRFLGTCEIRRNGDFGISITHGSSALFMAEQVTMARNSFGGMLVWGTSTAAFDTGAVHTTQNTLGILTFGHSSLTLSRNAPSIVADENTLDGILVADHSNLRLDGGMIIVSRNERTGLWFGGTAGLSNIAGTILLENNAVAGARAEDFSHISQLIAGQMTVRDNPIGLIADNGSDVRLDQGGTVTGNGTDIVLSFASRGTFNGNTIGTIQCDETSLVRGDTGVTCPNNP